MYLTNNRLCIMKFIAVMGRTGHRNTALSLTGQVLCSVVAELPTGRTLNVEH